MCTFRNGVLLDRARLAFPRPWALRGQRPPEPLAAVATAAAAHLLAGEPSTARLTPAHQSESTAPRAPGANAISFAKLVCPNFIRQIAVICPGMYYRRWE